MAEKTAGKKSFNPPQKSKNKTELPPKTTVSLTEEQYNDIFNAVLHPSQSLSQKELEVKSPTMGAFAGNQAKSPKETASVENSQHTQNSQPEQTAQKKNEIPTKYSESTLSTLNSEDITKNAAFSTPTQPPKPEKTFLQTLKNIRKRMNDSLSEAESMSESFSTGMMDFIKNEPLSLPPKNLTKRERLQWLQDRRGNGLYVKCDQASCAKWRWLDNPDPVDLPQKWYCYLNPDKNLASCSVAEQYISVYTERDLIQNLYTAGSIVWAKITGYPWWPALVCDCPSTEQYYWMDNELDDEPDWYHVVFFDIDNQVTRKWLRLNDLRSFKHCPDFDKKFSTFSYKKRIEISKQKAKEALKLSVKERLARFSFLALWKKEIFEDSEEDSDESDIDLQNTQFKRYVKKLIFKRRSAMASKARPCHSIDNSCNSITSSIFNSPVHKPKKSNKNTVTSSKNIVMKLDEKIKEMKKIEKEKSDKKKIHQKKTVKEKAEKENATKKSAKISNARRNSNVNKTLNKPSNFENRIVTRRMSTGDMKENIPQHKANIRSQKNPQHYEEDEIEKAVEIYNDFMKNLRDSSNNYENILETCTEIFEANQISPPQSLKKKHLRKSSSAVGIDRKNSKEFEAKRQKTDEKIEPSKMEKIITKAKKGFKPPVKKNLDLSASTDDTDI